MTHTHLTSAREKFATSAPSGETRGKPPTPCFRSSSKHSLAVGDQATIQVQLHTHPHSGTQKHTSHTRGIAPVAVVADAVRILSVPIGNSMPTGIPPSVPSTGKFSLRAHTCQCQCGDIVTT